MTPVLPGGIPHVDGADGVPDTPDRGCDAALQGPTDATTYVHILKNVHVHLCTTNVNFVIIV